METVSSSLVKKTLVDKFTAKGGFRLGEGRTQQSGITKSSLASIALKEISVNRKDDVLRDEPNGHLFGEGFQRILEAPIGPLIGSGPLGKLRAEGCQHYTFIGFNEVQLIPFVEMVIFNDRLGQSNTEAVTHSAHGSLEHGVLL